MTVRSICIGALALALFTVSTASADGSVRCGSKLVTTGDSMYDARTRCGEPDDKQHRTEMRTERTWISAPCVVPGQVSCGRMLERTVEVAIDEWLYDFGPQRFIQRLTFEQGRLIGVVSGSYGVKQS